MIKEIKVALDQIKHLLLVNPKFHNFLQCALSITVGKKADKLLLKDGIVLCAPKNHPLIEMVSQIFIQRIYTPDNFQIGPNDLVVDIGANIGVFSLFAAIQTGNKVYAFEPCSENIAYLRKNMHTNGVQNVEEREIAVSDQIGFKKLYLARNPAAHYLLSNHKFDKKQGNYTNSRTTTLQAIVDNNNLKQIDFLKMDCEGPEGDILMSTPREYLRKVKKIAIEFHDNMSVLKHNEIQELLEAAGFVTKLRWDGKGPFGYIYAYNKYE